MLCNTSCTSSSSHLTLYKLCSKRQTGHPKETEGQLIYIHIMSAFEQLPTLTGCTKADAGML